MSDGMLLDLYGDDLQNDCETKSPDEFSGGVLNLYDDIGAVSEGDGAAGENSGAPGNADCLASRDPSSFNHNGGANMAPSHKSRRFQLFVGNLTWWTTDQDISDAVKATGVADFQDVRFFENRTNGLSKGFCVITLGSEHSLRDVLEHLPKKALHGQQPVVTYPSKQALNQFESLWKARQPQLQNAPPRGPAPPQMGGGPMPQHSVIQCMPSSHQPSMMTPNMPPSHQPRVMTPNMPPGHQPRMMTPNMPPGHQPRMMTPNMPPSHQPRMMTPNMPPGHQPRMMTPNMPPGQYHPQHMLQRPPVGPNSAPCIQTPMQGGPMGPQQPLQGQPCYPNGPQPGPSNGQLQQIFHGPHGGMPMRGPRPDWNRPMHGGFPPGQPVGPPQALGHMTGPPRGPPRMGGPAGPAPQGGPLPHFNPAFLNKPQLTESEFQEIMGRNRIVSNSAIARAISDAGAGEHTSAIETLVTAISLIKKSKVAHDDRCKSLISSLEITLECVEAKSNDHRERSRSRQRTYHGSRDRRDGSTSSRYREREGHRERSRARENHRDDSSSRSARLRRSSEQAVETPRQRNYFEEQYRSSNRDCERERDRGRDRVRDRERTVEHQARRH